VTISIVGTNDLHGRVLALPLLAGYVANLRAARAEDGGAAILVDAGDMFQGTLESNLVEGASIVDAYSEMGYAAAAIGNHEFDFGPAGPAVTAAEPGDDPRGALKAAASRAKFPFLTANTRVASTGAHVDWANMPASTTVRVAGVSVGIIGVTTPETATTTIHANVADLSFAPLADTVAEEAKKLRASGVDVVVVAAHAGGKCQSFTGDVAKDHCEAKSEIFDLARALPSGAVDAIVGGHSHAGIAHEVAGIPIIEQHSYGRAFGRVDLTVSGSPPRVVAHHVFAPQDLCPGQDKPDFTTCAPVAYEGKPVTRSADIAAVIAPAIEGAKEKRAEKLGTVFSATMDRSYDHESALGNLFADLLREATPGADVGFMNGGGLRAELPAGALTFGALFEAFPFDNRVATAKITGARLKDLLAAHLARSAGILSLSGVRLDARCDKGALAIKLVRDSGKPVADTDTLTVAGSDFLFTGGDDFWGGGAVPAVDVKDELMRDALVRAIAKHAKVAPKDAFDPKKPRMKLPSDRPIRCP
jgi:5'-nucleotidase